MSRKRNGMTLAAPPSESNGAATKPASTPPVSFDPQADAATTVNAAAANGSETMPADNEQPPTPPATDPPAANGVQVVLFEAPMGDCEDGYATTSINFQGMTNRQSAAAKRLFISLGRQNRRIQMNGVGHPDGKVVNNYGDAVRWIFEQLADAWEAETGQDITKGLVSHG